MLLVFAFALLGICSAKVLRYREQVLRISKTYSLEPDLVLSIIYVESSFNTNAVSNKGACGLMQILPSTAEYIAKKIGYCNQIDLFNSECNLILGCAYIDYLSNKFKNECAVLCAYNAGEGVVSNWLANKKYSFDGKTLSCIPYSQTHYYVKKVLKYKCIFKIYVRGSL